jgi:hypothetical protein
MDRGDDQKCRKAGRETLPAHDQTAVLLLKPGKGPLGLETRHLDLDGAAARFLDFPNSLRNLRSDAPFTEVPAEVFRIPAVQTEPGYLGPDDEFRELDERA